MHRRKFPFTARTPSTGHISSASGSVREKGRTIVSDVAREIGIHISTASKDLSVLRDCRFLDRSIGTRKTRPAYECRFKSDSTVPELMLDDCSILPGEEMCALSPHLFDRLFDAAAAEASESFPNLAGKYDLMADLGVVVDG